MIAGMLADNRRNIDNNKNNDIDNDNDYDERWLCMQHDKLEGDVAYQIPRELSGSCRCPNAWWSCPQSAGAHCIRQVSSPAG